MVRHWLAVGTLILSCGVAQMSENDAGPFDAGAVDCVSSHCTAEGCRALSGWRSQGPDAGMGVRSYAGCRFTAGVLPGTAMTCGRAPDGRCWLFTDTDVPDDFVPSACNHDAPDFCPPY